MTTIAIIICVEVATAVLVVDVVRLVSWSRCIASVSLVTSASKDLELLMLLRGKGRIADDDDAVASTLCSYGNSTTYNINSRHD